MRLLLADDQELVRDGIAAVLRNEADIEVETVCDLPEALARVGTAPPFDLILLDFMMPGMNRLEGLAQMKAAAPGVPVALLTGVAPAAAADQAVAQGAAGFLPKTMSTRSLIAAVRFMAAGETYLPITLTTQAENALQELGQAQLTPRELDVFKRLARGLANKEIARELGLQEVTVKLHVKTLYRKIGARNRTEAALLARNQGLG
jgi:DNA-binding NarL/FixJ family response regulator